MVRKKLTDLLSTQKKVRKKRKQKKKKKKTRLFHIRQDITTCKIFEETPLSSKHKIDSYKDNEENEQIKEKLSFLVEETTVRS